MTGVLIVAHHERAEAGDLARQAADWIRARGWQVWMTKEDATALDLPELAADRPPAEADLVLSLGGDGTTLRAAEMVGGSRTDILGVNVGLLGYLSEIEPSELTSALERYARGEFTSERRMMLTASARPGASVTAEADRPGPAEVALPEQSPPTWRALNEVVIERRESGHTVRLGVTIDDVPFTTYAADGMIVATPTGSTAYSLSARGPVVSPEHRALLVTPVSPHMLFDRALVLGPEQVIEIELLGHRRADLNVDGQRAAILDPGTIVRCEAAAESARFVRFRPGRFHQILKAKFGLSDR
jgi:NAD+ kinase